MLNEQPMGIDFKNTLSADFKVGIWPSMLPERSAMNTTSGFCDLMLNLGTNVVINAR